jgi:hypothetical protein
MSLLPSQGGVVREFLSCIRHSTWGNLPVQVAKLVQIAKTHIQHHSNLEKQQAYIQPAVHTHIAQASTIKTVTVMFLSLLLYVSMCVVFMLVEEEACDD